MDSGKKAVLEDFKCTLKDKFDRNLVEAYAKTFDYADLEKVFLEQLVEEASSKDET